MILVTGFGPFQDVVDNPSARLARGVNGLRVAGETIRGEVLPVSYSRAAAETLRLIELLNPRFVIGTGVAVSRSQVQVERWGRRAMQPSEDVDGVVVPSLPDLGDCVPSTLDPEKLAKSLAASVSEDAGTYVCNAWLYQVAGAAEVPVSFVHVPASGLAVTRFMAGLQHLLTKGTGGD